MDKRSITSAENGRKFGGRPKGSWASHTIEAAKKKEYIVRRVNAATEKIMNSQLSLAQGVSFLYRIDKDEKGNNEKPELVVSQTEIEEYLRGDFDYSKSYYYITTEKPDNRAIDSLLDRVHGKSSPDVAVQVNTQVNVALILK